MPCVAPAQRGPLLAAALGATTAIEAVLADCPAGPPASQRPVFGGGGDWRSARRGPRRGGGGGLRCVRPAGGGWARASWADSAVLGTSAKLLPLDLAIGMCQPLVGACLAAAAAAALMTRLSSLFGPAGGLHRRARAGCGAPLAGRSAAVGARTGRGLATTSHLPMAIQLDSPSLWEVFDGGPQINS